VATAADSELPERKTAGAMAAAVGAIGAGKEGAGKAGANRSLE
jgi:hypothetical protein